MRYTPYMRADGDYQQAEDIPMNAMQTAEYARALYSAHGDKAEAEAARKMHECELAESPDKARDWKAIRQAIRSMRGPNQS